MEEVQNSTFSLKIMVSAGTICAFHMGGNVDEVITDPSMPEVPRWEYFIGDRCVDPTCARAPCLLPGVCGHVDGLVAAVAAVAALCDVRHDDGAMCHKGDTCIPLVYNFYQLYPRIEWLQAALESCHVPHTSTSSSHGLPFRCISCPEAMLPPCPRNP
jgi:hypothetical protein